MIEKRKVWESKRAILEYYEALSLLVKRYKQFLPSSEYRDVMLKSLQYYTELRCNHLVVDSAFAGPVSENDIVWACEQYESIANKSLLDKLHVVRPYSVYTQYSILEFQRRLYGSIPILVYPTMEEVLNSIKPNLIPAK
ncbi:hypothetical protein KDU71_07750 [Carboxylicivirga sediminis]|uniref:Uncharacterized protein n=1 Tax=Carboxylicivirga sediminis TaxID=2006564 RepID=A0A941F356_9BACT|nr:hypothetical protein [Carboxylicivirga sediminis]MBR8535449.1 hypothetical protein [Carboxylicivirga sediminis]